MTGERIPVTVLAVQMIANAPAALCKALGLRGKQRTLGIISSDCDDATYIALDEATKSANVDVIYAKSLYAGAANASTKLAGEVIGVIAGENPSEVKSGLQAAASVLGEIGFRTANDEGDIVYFAHCVSRTGSYLSKLAHVPLGQAVAYLIAPPVEAIVGLDAAIKASDVEMTEFFAPPSETNFAGGVLTGTQSACKAACEAFAEAVKGVASAPRGELYGI
ncbi:MAG: ethanolamine utilization microcompartment protein EutL [Ruminococcaceae bacterium]|nr:ethanolamine utilization microcompartment protein EutL [Oscillospiraceae bacterium]